MLRVVPPFDASDIEAVRWSFDVGGLRNMQLYERALAAVCRWRFGADVWLTDERIGVGRSFADFERLLDFGCGCGRLLRHLGPIADQVEIHGADIDREMIEWLRENIPFATFEVTAPEPPLPYPDHHFDLVLCHSVFTHLDEHLQDAWLAELRRVTTPDAMLLVSVQGQSTWARTRAAAPKEDAARWQDELESRGILFIADDAFVGSTHPEFYHSTIHAPWYVFEHWSKYFDIDAHLPDGAWAQDLVVLRRGGDEVASSRPSIRSRSNAPASQTHPSSDTPELINRGRAVVRRVGETIGRRHGRIFTAPTDDAPGLEQFRREIQMLRAGLYEQGRRISVLGAELRDEIAKSRDRRPSQD